MIVSEFIKELSKYPKDAKVKATWEGTFEEVSVYLYKDGKTVMIDADADFYRDRFEYKKKNDEEFTVFKTQFNVKPKDLRRVEKNKNKILEDGLKIEHEDHFKRIHFFKDLDKQKIKELKKGNDILKVGDFLNTNWGYDQTNIELFVVKKIIGKNYFIIQEVAQKTNEGGNITYDLVSVSDEVYKIDIPRKAFISNDGYKSICEGGYKRSLSHTDIKEQHYKTNSQSGH